MFELIEVKVRSRILLKTENINFFQYFYIYLLIKKSLMVVCFIFCTKCQLIWPPIWLAYDWIVSLSSANKDNFFTVTGKRVNLGDGKGLQIPCTLHFTGEVQYINKLKDILIVINIKIKNINFSSFLSLFVIMNARKFELASVFWPVGGRNRSN